MAVDRALGELVAEREYEATDPRGGEARKVVLRVGTPRAAPDPGGHWLCPVQIVGIGDDNVLEAAGVDAVQALSLALVMAGVKLTCPPPGVTITWLGGSDLGLPLPDPNAAHFAFGDDDEPDR
jgi:hypothetical protein